MNQPKNKYEELYEINIKYDRGNATYKPDELVTGFLLLQHKHNNTFKVDVQSITMSILGQLNVQNKNNNKTLENIVNIIKQITIIKIDNMQLARNKTITHETKLPFRFKLEKGQHRYLETYIGVFINIAYNIKTTIKFDDGQLKEQTPFYLQVPKAGRETIENFVYPKVKHFLVRTEDIKGDQNKIPKFKIRGQLQSQIIYFNDDVNGSLTIDMAQSPIRSIDFQMVRVERVDVEGQKFMEKTQIQLIQLCDGNVTRNIQIPLYMILPRYYSCPSVKYQWCTLDFEINLVIIFKDGFKVTCNIPLNLIRS